MAKRLFILLALVVSFNSKGQCPQVYDYLNNLSSNPYWIDCGGGPYTLNFKSNVAWGSYSIDWGDGTPTFTASSYVANSSIPHNYAATIDTFVVTLTIPALSCTMTGVVVIERPASAQISLPGGGTSSGCVPANLQFVNTSSNVSETTKFSWDFGDGSAPVPFTYTNGGVTVAHTYTSGNCSGVVTLTAQNYCSMGVPSVATFTPVQIFEKDVANIVPSDFVKCLPSASFTYSNTTTTNCPGNNTFQRQEKWNLGNYWGMGNDSIIDWSPWPPITPATVSYTSTGTFTAQLMDSSFCGVSTQTISVTVLSAPSSSITTSGPSFCVNSPATFTNSSSTGYFYSWDFGDGGGFQILAFGPQSHTYSLTGTYTVSLVAFLPGAGSCSDTDRVVINIVPTPTANFTFTPPNGCNSVSNVNFTDASTSATGWSWDFGNGSTFSGSPTPPAQSYTTIGTYVISLSVTAANSCVNTKTSSITVYQNPTPAFSPTAGCVGSVISFTDQSTSAPTNTINAWTWDFGDGSPLAMTQNPTYAYSAAGTYTVKLVVSSSFCSDSISVPLTVNPRPVSLFTMSPSSGCPNLAVTFTNTTFGAVSYYWDFGVTPTATSNVTSPAFTYTNPSTSTLSQTVTLIAYSSFGCSDTIRKAVLVFGKPNASFTVNPINGCSPLALTFTNTSVGTAAYNWDFGDGALATTFQPSHTYTVGASPQTFTTELIVFSGNGCKDTTTQVITVSPGSFSSFSVTTNIGCSPLAITFTADPGATSYSWDFGDGSGTSTLQNPSYTYTNGTMGTVVYTASMIATNSFGCNDTVTNQFTVYPKPVADFTLTPGQGCSPLAVNFINFSVLNAANSWDFKDGAFDSAPNPVHTFTTNNPTGNTVFNIDLVVFSSDGCKDTATHAVTLFPHPIAGFAVDTPACSPKILTFTNTSQGAATYNWDFGNSVTSTQTNPTQQYINTGTTNVTYNIHLAVSNSDGCVDTLKTPLAVHPAPSFTIAATPDSGCANLKVIFPGLSGVTNYNWDFGDASTATLTSGTTHTFVNNSSSNMTFTTTLIATDVYGCQDTVTRKIKVFPKPVANFSADPLAVIVENQQVNFTNLSTGNVSNYWTFGDGIASSVANPVHVYNLPGEYQVKLVVTSNKGCKDTFELADKIIAKDEFVIKVPNAFTPNPNISNGGVYHPTQLDNDVFHPVIRGMDNSKYELSIYTRWGELIFVSTDVNVGWDGYYKGQLCNQDVYIWKVKGITLEGELIDKAGDVTLLR